MNDKENSFEEIPEGLVDEMLANSDKISLDLFEKFREIKEKKDKLRKELKDGGAAQELL